MTQEKLDRINELAGRKKEGTLTRAEADEQAALRAEYVAEFRASLRGILDHTVIRRPDGTEEPLVRKKQEEPERLPVYSGRPDDTSGRAETELAVYDLLDGLGVSYARTDHVPAMTMEDCAAIGEALGAPVAKNLLLANRQGTAFYLLMMPGDKVFKTKDLSAQLGIARLSFAGGDVMERLLRITPGSLSFLGLMNDREKEVTLLIDRDLLSEEAWGVHPCRNTSTLRLALSDVRERILPALGREPVYVTL